MANTNVVQLKPRRKSRERLDLILAFVDDSPSFAHGFEAGRIWQRMRTNRSIEQHIHNENRELLRRMAETKAWAIGFVAINNYWSKMTMTPPRAVT